MAFKGAFQPKLVCDSMMHIIMVKFSVCCYSILIIHGDILDFGEFINLLIEKNYLDCRNIPHRRRLLNSHKLLVQFLKLLYFPDCTVK